MSIRRFHQKSRSGCTKCKARRVKCGEEKPICRNCVRQGTECIYNKEGPNEPSWLSPTKSPTRHEAPEYDSLDLLLMHHFATTTAVGLFPSAEATHVWQNVVSVDAHKEPLLMHGILALAGMDLARSDRETGSVYRTRALHHQQVGLSLFQEILPSAGPEQIHVVFPFSLILIMLTFAGAQAEAEACSVDSILDYFGLYRGPRTLAKTNWHALQGSQVQSLLGKREQNGSHDEIELPETISQQLERIRPSKDGDPATCESFELLEECIKRSTRSLDLWAVGRWPAMIPDDFFMQLKDHQPDALVILATYSIVLSAFRERWWLGNWDRMLLVAVDRALSDGDKTRLDWRMDAMEGLLQPQYPKKMEIWPQSGRHRPL